MHPLIILNSPITQTIATQTIAKLPTHNHLYLNSWGGSVAAGLAIASALTHHTTINYGHAGSIAAWIFVSGQRRVMHHTAVIYLHDVAIGAETTLSEDRQVLERTRARETLIRLWAPYGIDPTVERWIEAQEAIGLGLCDEVI
jgi:ATP-dependent protease ClpP protease subunit